MIASPLPGATETPRYPQSLEGQQEHGNTTCPARASGDGSRREAEKRAAKKTGPSKATARAASAPVALDADGNPTKKSRRVMGDRNWLAREIDHVIRNGGSPASVRDIVTSITNKEGEHPSSGAVAAALKRWNEQGYINVTQSPLAFKSFPGEVQDRHARLLPGQAARGPSERASSAARSVCLTMKRGKYDAPFIPERRIVLPEHPFFYTLDQVATILQVSESWLRKRTSYAGRTIDTGRAMLRSVNLAEPDDSPVWRISERELLRWLAYHGVNIKSTTNEKRA